MPRSFLVKKIKGDGFQCSGVPAPTYHPLETAYVLPGARGPPGDNGEWDPAGLGGGRGKDGREEGVRGSPQLGLQGGLRAEGNPGRRLPVRCAPLGFPEDPGGWGRS